MFRSMAGGAAAAMVRVGAGLPAALAIRAMTGADLGAGADIGGGETAAGLAATMGTGLRSQEVGGLVLNIRGCPGGISRVGDKGVDRRVDGTGESVVRRRAVRRAADEGLGRSEVGIGTLHIHVKL